MDSELYKEYLKAQTNLTYVEWLERAYRDLQIWAEVAKGWLPRWDDDDPDYYQNGSEQGMPASTGEE